SVTTVTSARIGKWRLSYLQVEEMTPDVTRENALSEGSGVGSCWKSGHLDVSARYAAPLPPRCQVAIFPSALFRRKRLFHIALQTNCRFGDPAKAAIFGSRWQQPRGERRGVSGSLAHFWRPGWVGD